MADSSASNADDTFVYTKPRPTDEAASAAITAYVRINSAWREHADEQEKRIAFLDSRVQGLEHVIADRSTFEETSELTLAQQVTQLQAKILGLNAEISGLQAEVVRLQSEVEDAKFEGHRECREDVQRWKDTSAVANHKLEQLEGEARERRAEILNLKRQLGQAIRRNQD